MAVYIGREQSNWKVRRKLEDKEDIKADRKVRRKKKIRKGPQEIS